MFCRLRPYLVLAVLGLLFFGDLLLHPSQVLYSDHSDLLAMHLPMKRFLVRSWQQTGELPLWNPYSYGGMPFIHDVQVAAFYPLHLPLYFLPEEFVGAGMSWLIVAHVILAGWLMFAYAKYRGLGPAGALVAGIGFMFAGKWLLHVLAGGHYIMIPLAWLPLVLLLFEQAIERRSFARATWAGVIYSLIVLGSHPQMTLYAGIFIALWSLGAVLTFRVRNSAPHQPEASARPSLALRVGVADSRTIWESQLPAGEKDRWSRLLWWAGLGTWVASVAAALSAVQLFPALEAARQASRAAGVSGRDILAVCFPSIMGLIGPGWFETWEDRAGFGIVWLAAALSAVWSNRGRVRFEGAICLFVLLFSIGGAVLFQWLPGFHFFQIPVRMLMLLGLPVALLAGRTTQALVDEVESPGIASACLRKVLLRILVIGLLLALGSGIASYRAWRDQGGPLAEGTPSEGLARSPLDWAISVPGGAWLYWGQVVGITLLALWFLSRHHPRPTPQWKWGWGMILTFELWALVLPHVAVAPESSLYSPSACVRRLIEQKQKEPNRHWRVLDRGLRGFPSSTPLGAALPMLGGVEIEPVMGYNSFDVRRYKEYLQFIMDKDEPIAPRSGAFGYPIIDSFPIHNKSLLDLLGTRFLLQPSKSDVSLQAPGEPGRNPNWSLIDWDPQPAAYSFLQSGFRNLPEFTVYENRSCFPRAFMVHKAKPLVDRASVLDQMRATDFRREVLLEGAVPHSSTTQNAADEVTMRDNLPNRVVLRAKAAAPGYLVLTDVYFPGWTCEIDGHATPIHRADFLFRAVALDTGDHEVVFRFEPRSYLWGRHVSVAALIIVACMTLAAGLLSWERRRKGQQ